MSTTEKLKRPSMNASKRRLTTREQYFPHQFLLHRQKIRAHPLAPVATSPQKRCAALSRHERCHLSCSFLTILSDLGGKDGGVPQAELSTSAKGHLADR